MNKKKVIGQIEQILKYCDQAYNSNWQPKSFEEFIKLGNICREAIKELSKSDWVSVEDELPEYGEAVLVCHKDFPHIIRIANRVSGERNCFTDSNGFIRNEFDLPVSHWHKIDKLEV